MEPIVLFRRAPLGQAAPGDGAGAGGIALVWVCIGVGMLDTVNAIIQSIRYSVFTYALGINWVILTVYVPALLVSSVLIFWLLLDSNRSSRTE